MTVGELIELLRQVDASLPVVLDIEPAGDEDHVVTFMTDAQISERHNQQTYRGDMSVARIRVLSDAP